MVVKKVTFKEDENKTHHITAYEDDDFEYQEENVNIFEEDDVEESDVEIEREDKEKIHGIPITPFNMNDELEEGFILQDGMYVMSNSKRIRDDWLDQIGHVVYEPTREPSKEIEEKDEPVNREEVIREIRGFLKPGESVLEAIQRFGGESKSASQRWSKKRKNTSDCSQGDEKSLLRLTELANLLVSEGEMDVYQYTSDIMGEMLGERAESAVVIDLYPKRDDVTYDMFGD